ncbi:DUF3329 domain-containing protein [Silicimonas algicola]|uniref:DUF3329 domain-containing protein n=1 Tax=Silicimonas algicola TaxID=1826607 RepID=A0A316GA29_9RHOB|nr:hypothetical protein [Silicimonas algicola]AZQ67801.1 DUF3329 domain-containing protein [Silicimonas algicola]PWK57781.1 hypothetical protein C8D95_102429 [Silicimonas algicola]
MDLRNAFEVRHPFFRPLWRRIVVTVLCAVWAGVEYQGGNATWAVLFAACAIYLGYRFFVSFDPADYEPPAAAPQPERSDS